MGIDVYLEMGAKRVFAGALDWPGWTRSGRDESSALQALLDYAPRYARAIRPARLGFQPPKALSEFAVVERLRGDAGTDFGSPEKAPSRDQDPVSDADLKRFQSLLKACWRSLDEIAASAKGKRLRTGPRGGGRDLKKMTGHVLEAEHAYITRLGWKWDAAPVTRLDAVHGIALEAMAASARGEFPERGPRGGLRWKVRYFTRRAAWHVLDHAWEIEDRLL